MILYLLKRIKLKMLFLALLLCTSATMTFAAIDIDPRIELQNKIDVDAPLNVATYVGTHNSYNAGAYRYFPYLARYIFPNHSLSVTDQLRAGSRFIEYDVHYTKHSHSGKLSNDLLLCHGRANDIGCSMTDRTLGEGFSELRKWLEKNPKQVVFLYIEDYSDGQHDKFSKAIETGLGDFVLKPSDIGVVASPGICPSVPMTLTKTQALEAGLVKNKHSQVVLFKKSCGGDASPILKWMFTGFGGSYRKPIESGVAHFEGVKEHDDPTVDVYPDCGRQTSFSEDTEHHYPWRIFESRAGFDQFFKPSKLMELEDAKIVSKCGVNFINFDDIKLNDKRLLATIWSWAPGYPSQQSETAQAIYSPEQNGLTDLSVEEALQQKYPALCKEQGTSNWALTKAVDVSQASKQCQSELGPTWLYSMAMNGLDMQRIRDQVDTSESFWVNYKKAEGAWKAKYTP